MDVNERFSGVPGSLARISVACNNHIEIRAEFYTYSRYRILPPAIYCLQKNQSFPGVRTVRGPNISDSVFIGPSTV